MLIIFGFYLIFKREDYITPSEDEEDDNPLLCGAPNLNISEQIEPTYSNHSPTEHGNIMNNNNNNNNNSNGHLQAPQQYPSKNYGHTHRDGYNAYVVPTPRGWDPNTSLAQSPRNPQVKFIVILSKHVITC